jgi:hypothetical protein
MALLADGLTYSQISRRRGLRLATVERVAAESAMRRASNRGRSMPTSRDSVRYLPQQLRDAGLLSGGAIRAFERLVGRDRDLAELEAVEQKLEAARAALSGCERQVAALRDSIRLALVEAGADGWHIEHRQAINSPDAA